MKAIYHRTSEEEEEVEILDIYVDENGDPKVLFVDSGNTVTSAPINRFTNFKGESRENESLDK